jgi:hypothetical protein
MSREIMQRSLATFKALDEGGGLGYENHALIRRQIEDLEAELAKPEQEPEIVRRVKRYMGKRRESVGSPHITAKECIALANWIDSMLFAPSRKEWVGLTEHDIELTFLISGSTAENFARAIESRLKELNT